jgi:ABC-type uncharacterized transport system substrate-binding protein
MVRSPEVGVLANLSYPTVHELMAELHKAADALDQRLLVLDSGEQSIEAAFQTFVDRQVGALLVASDPFLVARREQIVALAARHAIPTIYMQREFVAIGGLVSYGVSFPGVYRQLGNYTGRILKGAKPADLPVLLPTTFELVINRKTAKALGVTIPPSLLARADEVIE